MKVEHVRKIIITIENESDLTHFKEMVKPFQVKYNIDTSGSPDDGGEFEEDSLCGFAGRIIEQLYNY